MSKKIPSIVKNIQNTIFNEIDYRYQKGISYSQLAMFANCPHKWALQYRDGNYIYEQTIHTVFGTSMHNTIQNYLTQAYNISTVEADNIDLNEYFETELSKVYKESYASNNKTHFTNPAELREFYDDGIEILDFLKKKKHEYFGKKGWFLVGCEIPIQLIPNPDYKNVVYKGFLDMVLYHEPTNRFKIIDFKTSRAGWNDSTKRDELKQFQLILYKYFFGILHKIPFDDIDVEFIILKRKLWEKSEFVQKRMQTFSPPSGKIKLKKALQLLDNFIISCFNKDGSYKTDIFEPMPDKTNCSYCSYKTKKDLCPKGIS